MPLGMATRRGGPVLGCLLLGDVPAGELAGLARAVEGWGYDTLWHADERFFRDVYASLAVCALATRRIALGPCVTDPYLRHPALTGMAIATLDEIAGGRAILGIGTGVSGFREMGVAQPRPAVALRDAILMLRELARGGPVTFEGELARLHGAALQVPLRADLPVYVAAKGPRNLRVAGALAQGVIVSSCVTDASIDDVLEAVGAGAARAGRDRRDVRLCSRVNVSIDADGDAARRAVKPLIARLLVSKQPDFSFLQPCGLRMPDRLRERVEATSYGHDAEAMAAVAELIPDEFAAALALAGPPEDVAAEVRRMHRRGVGEIIVYPLPTPGRRPEDVLRAFAEDVMPLAAAPGPVP